MLSCADFDEESDATVPDFLGTYKQEHGIYAVQMARLAQLRMLRETLFYFALLTDTGSRQSHNKPIRAQWRSSRQRRKIKTY